MTKLLIKTCFKLSLSKAPPHLKTKYHYHFPGWSCGTSCFSLPIFDPLPLFFTFWSGGDAQRDLRGAEIWSHLRRHWGSLKIGSHAMPGIENDHQSNQIPHYSSQVQLSTLPVAVCFGDGKNHINTYHFPLVWLHFQLLLFCNCFRWNCYWSPRICCNQCPWISSDDDQMIRNCME